MDEMSGRQEKASAVLGDKPTNLRDIPDPLTDGDPEHFAAAQRSTDPVSVLMRQGLFLYRALLEGGVRPWELTGTNDFSAAACFSRAYRAIRASTLVTVFGYYEEVPTLLREAYECAAMGRYLARQPQLADKWLESGEWVPDRKVRAWFGDTEGVYSDRYGGLSRRSHPTAAACLRLIDAREEGYVLRLASEFKGGTYTDCLYEGLATLIWMIFALKNAVADEEIIPPDWRQASVEWAEEAGALLSRHTGAAINFDHLDHDWEKISAGYERLVGSVHRSDTLESVIDQHPSSVRNLKKNLDQDGATSESE